MIKKRDIILIGSILLAALLCLTVTLITKQKGNVVVVYVNNSEYIRMRLDEDSELLIQGVDSGTNLLIVKDGKAYIKEASCPDKVCVNTGSISNENDMIVCLPNKVVAVIERDD